MTMSCRSRFLSVLIASMLAPFGSAAAAELSTVADFSITAQPLSTALIEFAKQANVQVLTAGYEVEGVGASNIAGRLTLDAALERMLKGSGFTYRFLDDKTLILVKEDKASVATSKALLLGQGEASGSSKEYTRLAQPGSRTEETAEANAASTDTKDAPALEEIVVTAEKRAESLQRVPLAISAFSGETLTNRGVEGIESLPQLAPSLQVGNSFGAGARVAMRGIGTELANIGGESAVAVTQDGVGYTSLEMFSLDFFDIERIEVLRGPQGTISGRNATAGAINVHSKRPTEEVEGGFKATLGNYGRLATEGYLSGPIASDRLLGRLAVHTDRAEGWVTNTLLGQDFGTIDKVQARASLLARLSNDFEAHLILEGLRDRSNQFLVDDGRRLRPDTPSVTEFYGVPAFDWDNRTIQQGELSNVDIEKYQATLGLAWDLGPSVRLTAVTGYVDQFAASSIDNDGVAVPLIVIAPNDGEHFDTWQLSQEITLTADVTDRLDVIFGALYQRYDQEKGVDFGLPALGVPLGSAPFLAFQKLTSWAGYTQWRYRLTDGIRLSAGFRYTHDSKRYADRSSIFGIPLFADDDGSWSAWTPRFALDYIPSDDLTLYASVSRGFKSGGYDTFSAPIDRFEPEFVWNYEVGLKANWLDQRVKTVLTGFYMNYTDLQQSIFGIDPGSFLPRTVNVNSATIKGVELEFDALVTDQFRVTAAGTWLDATYDELRSHDTLFPELGISGPIGLNVRDASGNRLVRAPKWQFNISGEYRVPVGSGLQGVLSASYAWQDKVYFDFFNHEAISQEAYGLVNLLGSIESNDGAWQFSAHVRNLMDQEYVTREDALVGFAAVPFSFAFAGLPRTYGVSLAHRF